MARDSESSESKSKLKFFKNAKAQNEPPVPEGAEPTVAAAQTAVATELEQPAVAEAKAEVAKQETGEAKQPEPEQSEAPAAARRPGKRAHVKVNLGGVFASSVALGVRALVILAIISVGAIAAAFVVAKVIGPIVAKAQVAEVRKQIEQITVTAGGAPGKTEAKSGGGHKAKGGHGGGHGGAGAATEIADLVVNPAGSEGMRYLCVSVSLEASSEAASSELAGRQSQVRDALIGILGARTVTELSNVETRDHLREEIRQSISGLLSQGEVEAVYFSNFVLQ